MQSIAPLEPTLDDKRTILDQKLRQIKAQAYEYGINAEMVDAQLPLAKNDASRKELLAAAQNARETSRALYASAAVLQERLAELPEPEDSSPQPD